MSVQSYLAFAQPEKFSQMVAKLRAIEGVEVYPADNREVAILVWDSSGAPPDRKSPVASESIEELQCLAMVFGHTDQ